MSTSTRRGGGQYLMLFNTIWYIYYVEMIRMSIDTALPLSSTDWHHSHWLLQGSVSSPIRLGQCLRPRACFASTPDRHDFSCGCSVLPAVGPVARACFNCPRHNGSHALGSSPVLRSCMTCSPKRQSKRWWQSHHASIAMCGMVGQILSRHYWACAQR